MRHVARRGGVSADEALRRVSPRRRRERRRLARVDGRANRPRCAGSTVTPTVAARRPGKSANNNQPSGLDVQGICQFHSPRAGTHAGTKLASDQPVISDCTRPRPAGVNGIFQFLFLRVRGRTRVRSREQLGNHLSVPAGRRFCGTFSQCPSFCPTDTLKNLADVVPSSAGGTMPHMSVGESPSRPQIV